MSSLLSGGPDPFLDATVQALISSRSKRNRWPIGTAIGLAAALVLTKVMSTLLLGVGPTDTSSDAFTLALVSIGALAVALLACYIPARRATKVDPLVALRNE